MPQELQIIRASEFIRVSAQGHFDLAASQAALARLAGACRKRGIHQAMIDLRTVHPGPKPVFSPADLAELVGTFRQMGFDPQDRLALLYHSDPHHRARLFAFLSTIHGWSVRAFGDFEKALLWLSEGEPAATQHRRAPAEKEVPVQFLKRAARSAARKHHSLRTVAMAVLMPVALVALVSCSSTPKVEKATTVAYREGVPGGTWIETYKINVTVADVDAAGRKVTLRAPDGSTNSFTAKPDNRTFDQLKTGEALQATVTRQLVIFLRSNGARLNDPPAVAAALTPDNAESNLAKSDTLEVIARVAAVDRKRRQVTLELPNGTLKTFAIRKDVDLKKARLGDEVVIRTRSAVVLAPEKP